MKTIKKKDFVEIKYTGYANGKIFDSNIPEDLKQLDEKAKPKQTIVIIGEGMLIPGLDKALEGKEIDKKYEITISPKEAFGERKRNLIKTIPLKIFTEKKVNPYPGLVLALDRNIAKVIAVSGARVITDFNNPLSGKELKYNFKIVRKVTDEKERIKVVLELLLKFVPDFEIKDKVIIKGAKVLEQIIPRINDKFREFIGKDIIFEEVKETPKGGKEELEKEGEKNNQPKPEKATKGEAK